jgi:hypothetical protein
MYWKMSAITLNYEIKVDATRRGVGFLLLLWNFNIWLGRKLKSFDMGGCESLRGKRENIHWEIFLFANSGNQLAGITQVREFSRLSLAKKRSAFINYASFIGLKQRSTSKSPHNRPKLSTNRTVPTLRRAIFLQLSDFIAVKLIALQ